MLRNTCSITSHKLAFLITALFLVQGIFANHSLHTEAKESPKSPPVVIYDTIIQVYVCYQDTYTLPDGTIYSNITGNFTHTITYLSQSLDDSLITYEILLHPYSNYTVSIPVCGNTNYTFPDGTVQWITGPISHTSNLTTIHGCDSTITTNIVLSPGYNLTQNLSACENSVTTFPDGSSAVISSNLTHVSNLTTYAGCDSIITTNVTMIPYPNSGLPTNLVLCQNGPVTDLFPLVQGNPLSGGFWLPFLPSGPGLFDPANDNVGTYYYTISNACGSTSNPVTISFEPIPNPGLNGTIPLCTYDNPVDLFTILNGTPQTGGSWVPALSSGTGWFDPSMDLGGVYQYVITTPCGSYSADVNVILRIPDNASIAYPADTFCLLDANPIPTINGLSGGTFSISNNGSINPTTGEIDVFNSGTGLFVVSYTTNGLCPIQTTDTLVVLANADASIASIGPFCEDDPVIDLVANSPGGVWSGKGVDGTKGTFDPSLAGPGTHTIIYTIGGMCGDSDTMTIVVNPLPFIQTIPDTIIDVSNSVVLTTSTSLFTNYSWSPSTYLSCNDCQNPISTPDETITYTVSITENGCTNSDQVTIQVIKEELIYIPTIFSPNDDGNNDVFYVRGNGIKKLLFVVYDRWGEKVFESSNIKEGWDGTFRGIPMKPALFMYYVKAEFESGRKEVLKGDVTLIR